MTKLKKKYIYKNDVKNIYLIVKYLFIYKKSA
jgi:hypothetical protein